MKVLFFTLEFPPMIGGAGVAADNLIKGLCTNSTDLDIEVLTIKSSTPLRKMAKFINNTFSIRFWYLWAPLLLVSKFFFDRKKIDTLIIWDYYAFLVTPVRLLKYIDIQCIYVIHGPELDYLAKPKKLRDVLFCFLNQTKRKLKLLNKIVAVSEPYKKRASNLFPFIEEKLRVVHNGVDIFKNSSIRKSNINMETIFVVVCRLVPLKRVDFIIKAFIKTKLYDIGCKLFIVGDGPSRYELEKLAEDIPGIMFVGQYSRDGVSNIILGSDYLIAFSDNNESFGLAILEAASFGVPSITSTVFQDNGVVLDKITGLVVKDDTIVNLSNLMLYAHNKKFEIWYNLSAAAAAFSSEKFSIEKMAFKYRNLLYER